MNLVPLSSDYHADLRLRSLTSYQFARGSAAVSLYGTEVARAAHEFPVIFTAEPEGFFPGALMSLDGERNVFVDDHGRWLSGYIPAVWRRSAFRLAHHPRAVGLVLCLDESSELISREDGSPLYSPDRKPTPMVHQITQFLSHLEADRIATLNACALLDRMGLIAPVDLSNLPPAMAGLRLKGLFLIDEKKLAALSGDGLAELRDGGALAMIYAHLLSLQKFSLLSRLAAERAEEKMRREALTEGKLNLDQLFGIVEDDPFTF